MTGSGPVVHAARIPRGTCKLFGAIKALSTIKKSVVLVHGPKGCVYHINYILGMRGDRPSEIYTTGLDEHDVIFGAEQKLKDAIEELDRTLQPELIFVLSCCTSSIIGEDVGSAVRDTATKSRAIAISAGGFEGDFHTGYSETLCQIAGQLVRKEERMIPRSVNLIGMLRAGPDLAELKRVLALAGVTVNAVLTADATRDELERLGAAALNIVVCEPSGKEAAQLLRKLCGTPYIIGEIPIGHQSTIRFLERVTENLGIPAPASLPCAPDTAPDAASLKDRRIAIVSDPTRAVSVTRFLTEYGVVPRLVMVDFDSSVKEKIGDLVRPPCEILIEPEQELIVQKLKEHKIDLLLGGMLEHPVAKALSIEHIDIMHGSERTAGFAGAENMVRLCCRKEQRRAGPGHE
ncbi:MAG: light-independent protochlorophyllide reductase subunit B [Methanoregula sp. PtaU1.Bin051]|nr:MAG: light-independent protochlorophyllide reductase subunit B [Methanoregula sp. PtaU1.Bin051]